MHVSVQPGVDWVAVPSGAPVADPPLLGAIERI